MQIVSPVSTRAQTSTEGDDAPEIVVKSIVYSSENPSAVIGTEIVHVGDEILGATILKINKDNVELQRGDKIWTQKVQR
jgi:hypothetical protein